MGLGERYLLWKLRRREPEACRELIRLHHAKVYGYLRRLGADATLAEDLTQETYTRAWQAIATLRRVASLRSWLLTIARNEFLQWVRAERPEMTVCGPTGDEADDGAGAESELLDAERQANVRRAVARLDPALREAIALHYFQGLSLREVGTVLGIPVGTAKSRIHRSLGCLRALLERQEADHERERAEQAFAGHS